MLNGVQYIRHSIDRIGISIPEERYYAVTECFGHKQKTIHTSSSIIELFDVKGCRVQGERIHNIHQKHNKRAFITLLQPTTECQIVVRDSISKHVPPMMYKQFNPSLNQVEIALDFVVADDTLVDVVQEKIQHHISLRYSRVGSRKYYEDTLYVGKKGVVRDGSKGVRVYDPSDKRKLQENMVRVELQLNRAFLTGSDLSVSSMPISPETVDVFQHIQFIEDIDDRTVDKVVKKVLQEVPKNQATVIKASIRRQLSNKLPVKRQYENLAKIKSKYKVSISKCAEKACSTEDLKNLIKKGNTMDLYVYARDKHDANAFIQQKKTTTPSINFIYIDSMLDIVNAPSGFNVILIGRCTMRDKWYQEILYMVLKDVVIFDINTYQKKGKLVDCNFDENILCSV